MPKYHFLSGALLNLSLLGLLLSDEELATFRRFGRVLTVERCLSIPYSCYQFAACIELKKSVWHVQEPLFEGNVARNQDPVASLLKYSLISPFSFTCFLISVRFV